MPMALARACRTFGCPNGSDCPDHGRKATIQRWDKARGTSSERGYGSRWRKYTSWYRGEQVRLGVPRAGLCGSRLPGAPVTQDSECAKQGLIVLGSVVDHIIPTQGPDDPRHYAPENHQLLCDGRTGRGCHDRKRQRERGR